MGDGDDEAGTTGAAAPVRRAARGRRDGAREAQEWTADRQALFFDQFAMSGDVAKAAQRAGMTARDAYAMRRRHRDFAAAWRGALDVGYDRLEAAIIRQVLGETDTKVDVASAMLLLERHRAGASAGGVAGSGARGEARRRAERELLKRLQGYGRRATAKEPA